MGWEKLPPTPQEGPEGQARALRSHPLTQLKASSGAWLGRGLLVPRAEARLCSQSRALGCWQHCQRGPCTLALMRLCKQLSSTGPGVELLVPG